MSTSDLDEISARLREQLLAAARVATHRAYAPYSQFHVGAAVLTERGAIYTGCNVENTSYGLTNCAERTAIFNAVCAEGAAMRLRAVAVCSDPEGACPPCGACRQVMLEFGPEALVIFAGPNGLEQQRVSQLLPSAFCL